MKTEKGSKDRRVTKTKRAIRDALISILEEKTPESITVKELSERAGINRKTFYAHYATPADLFSELEDEIAEAMRYLLRTELLADAGLSPQNFVASVNAIYESNPAFFESLMTVRNYAFLAEKLTETLKEEILKLPALASVEPHLAASMVEFSAGGLIHLYVNWIRTGKTVPFETVTGLAYALTMRGISGFLPKQQGGGSK